MERLTKSDQLRLAIAICALRFKPEAQSIAAWILDLRDRFRPYDPCYSEETSWKPLALKLEKENARLREQLDAENIRYLTLARKNDSLVPVIGSTGSNSGSNVVSGKSKKARKKVASDLHVGEWGTDIAPCLQYAQNDDRPAMAILFPAMDAFSRLLSLEASAVPQSLFVSTTYRSVKAVADSLDSLLLFATAHKNDKKQLEILNVTFQYVLEHGVPRLVHFSKTSKRKRKRDAKDSGSQKDPLDRFFALLQSRIFTRIIASTCRLSETYLTNLLSNADASHVAKTNNDARASKATDKFNEAPGDLRAGVMRLFETGAHLLFADPPSFCGISDRTFATKLSALHASLVLETVSELEKVIFGNLVHASTVPPSNVLRGCYSVADGSIHPPEDAFGRSDIRPSTYGISVHQRVNRLAIKDTVWYLCNIMHILLGGSSSAFMEGQGESGESPGGANVKGINEHGASSILLEAAKDILCRLMIRYRQEAVHDNVANSFCLSPVINSHTTEHESKRRAVQENSIGVDYFSDGKEQTGETSTSDVDRMTVGKKEELGSYTKTTVAYESGMGQITVPMIDDVTYNMLMGVVERFVLCKCLS